MEQNTFSLAVCNQAGVTLAQSSGTAQTVLLYDAPYCPGDAIVFTPDCAGYYAITLEDTLGEEFVYLNGQSLRWEIPFDEGRISYNPRAFEGTRHYIAARRATPAEIACPRNLARNVYDCHGNTACFPHAMANVETRNESVFAARNAIDGVIYPHCHGRYPFQSWGINRRPDAEWHLDFGRPVRAETLVLTTRADFPHDAWWTQATLILSDGTRHILALQKTAEGQSFDLGGTIIDGLTLCELIKADDPSPFPALTQVEVFGENI